MGILVAGTGPVVVVGFVLVALGVPYAGWLAFLLLAAWLVLSMAFAAVSIAFEHDPRVPPTLKTLVRTWLIVMARMAWLPFSLTARAVKSRRASGAR
jgi:hypothetical protein